MARPILLLVLLVLLPCLTACGERAQRGPPGLVFEPPVHDLGRLPAMQERVVRLPWRRTGAGALRVLGVRPDCACALVSEAPGRLAPGASGALRVGLAPRRAGGPFRLRVRVYTDASPPADRLVVEIRGHVGRAYAFLPPLLDLGLRSPGLKLARRVEVQFDGDDRPDGLGARLDGLEGRAALAPPARGDAAGCLLRLEVRVPQTPGAFAGRAVLLRDGTEVGGLPVSGAVAGATWRRPSAHPDRAPPR